MLCIYILCGGRYYKFHYDSTLSTDHITTGTARFVTMLLCLLDSNQSLDCATQFAIILIDSESTYVPLNVYSIERYKLFFILPLFSQSSETETCFSVQVSH